MTNQELLKNLQTIKNILSNKLNDKEVMQLMTNNKTYCIKSLIQKELTAKEIAEDLEEALIY